ncbi:hypothetical protein ARHIZOSPH14_29090 [Agromyces rhizosphaerae]|uniref:Secreted protein n=1 Tax=Agromyces rhizosphaerae TaxID=88374 RepID=A0A9W6FSE7_9MICO|nr:hypothetical protein [Agromyces rhizosphaerae]GLI28667.1 hypothetical protein ARHIZOSPH14_29090 [Agromyces rhizosphaerae]
MPDAPMPTPARGPSRRDVTRAMAWSVPAVAIAASVPAHAASGAMPVVLVGAPCNLPDATALSTCPSEILDGIFGRDTSEGFAFPLQISNTTGKDIVVREGIQITNVRDGFGETSTREPFEVLGTFPDSCTVIESGMTENVIVYANSGNAITDHVYFDLTVPWGHDCFDVDHPPIFIPDVYAELFPLCSSATPFPEGRPTCVPPFYQN